MRGSSFRCDQAGHLGQRPCEGAPVRRGQRRNRSNQATLHGVRLPTTPVLARRHPANQTSHDEPLNHDRDGALVRKRERRDVVHRHTRVFYDLQQGEELGAGQARAPLS
jgi:hypothetical protein